VHHLLRLVDPATGRDLVHRFLFQLNPGIQASLGAFLINGLFGGLVQGEHAHGDDNDTDERSCAANENQETVNRAWRVGRHIS